MSNDWSFPPLEGVTPLGAQPPPAHYGSGVVVKFDPPDADKANSSPTMFIRMDDGGEGYEGRHFIDLLDPTAEKRFQDLAKAKWRGILEACVGQDGNSRYTAAQLNTTASGPAWVLNQRVCYGFVPGDADFHNEFQFITPQELKQKKAAKAVPTRTPYAGKKKTKGKTGGGGHDAAPPPGGDFAPPPGGGGGSFTPPPGGQGGGGFAPPPGFGGAAPQTGQGGGAAPPPV